MYAETWQLGALERMPTLHAAASYRVRYVERARITLSLK